MNWLATVVLPLVALAAVYWITGRFRGYAMSRLIDVPNERSSHVVPTPRGGGIAIVAVVLLSLPVLALLGAITWQAAAAIFGAGAIVAVMGFADDHGHVKRRWRLLAHFGAGVWLLAWMGGPPPLALLGGVVYTGWLSYPLAVLFVAWMINVFNFMDGLDGIAGVEVLTVSIGGAILYFADTPGGGISPVPLVLAASAVGFLLWNWPPARIFLGDVGSGFFGVVTAGLALDAGWANPELFWAWTILLGVFVVDATVTIIRRTVQGDPFHQPHRTHAYQHAAARLGVHLPVTIAAGLITLFWLLPLALLVGLGRLEGAVGVIIAYIPLVFAAVWLKAGKASG